MAQYLKQDSALGYVEDIAEIENLKFNNSRHVVIGCMLGDFNENGTYVVSPEIVEELIHMEKYLVQSYDNIEFCKSCIKLDKQISFMVTFEGNRATLSLVEKLNYEANFAIDSGAYSNINEYVLDVVETSGEINRNAIYLRWNISTTPGAILDIFNCEDVILEKYFGIVNRFKYLLGANAVLLQKEEEIEEIEAAYANEILIILTRYPKLKQAVIKTIKATLDEKKDMVSVEKPYFAKTFNEILENAIEENIDVLDEQEKQEFAKDKRAAVVQANIQKADIMPIEMVEDKVSQKESSPNLVVFQLPKKVVVEDLATVASEYVAEVNKTIKRLEVGEHTSKVKHNTQKSRGQDLIGRLTQRVAAAQSEEPSVKSKNASSNPQRNKLIENLESLGVPRKQIGAKERVVPDLVSQTTTAVPTKPAVTNNKTRTQGESSTKGTKASKSSGGGSGGGSSGGKKPEKKPVVKAGSTKPGPIQTKKPPVKNRILFAMSLQPKAEEPRPEAQQVSLSLMEQLADVRDAVSKRPVTKEGLLEEKLAPKKGVVDKKENVGLAETISTTATSKGLVEDNLPHVAESVAVEPIAVDNKKPTNVNVGNVVKPASVNNRVGKVQQPASIDLDELIEELTNL